MTIKKGEPINFSPPVSVAIMFNDASEGIKFNGVINIVREDDNTFILTRTNGSKVLVPGNRYNFLEVEEDTE